MVRRGPVSPHRATASDRAQFGRLSLLRVCLVRDVGQFRVYFFSATKTAVVSAGTVAVPVVELNVDCLVTGSLDFCWWYWARSSPCVEVDPLRFDLIRLVFLSLDLSIVVSPLSGL